MSSLTIAAMLSLAQACGANVAPGTLLSIAWAESHWNATAENHNRNGTVDRGAMQINSENWQRLGLTRESASDPCNSIRAGARVLMENYHPKDNTPEEQQRALRVALAAYNAGPRGGPNEVYIRKVQAAAAYVIPEIRIAGIPATTAAPSPAVRPTQPPPPPPDVTARPASAGRELVFTRGNQ